MSMNINVNYKCQLNRTVFHFLPFYLWFRWNFISFRIVKTTIMPMKKHLNAQIFKYTYCNIEIITSKENLEVNNLIHNIHEKACLMFTLIISSITKLQLSFCMISNSIFHASYISHHNQIIILREIARKSVFQLESFSFLSLGSS